MILKIGRYVALVLFIAVAAIGIWLKQCSPTKEPEPAQDEEASVLDDVSDVLMQESKSTPQIVNYSAPEVSQVRRNFVPSSPSRRMAPTKESVGVEKVRKDGRRVYFGASSSVKTEKENKSVVQGAIDEVKRVAGVRADEIVQPAKLQPDNVQEQQVQAVTHIAGEPEFFAPTGRMIRCVLVNTLESSNIETPIVGYVAEPFVWDGVEIIPKGTEVHGWVDTGSYRDRIGAENFWRLVFHPSQLFPQGGSIEINARVLHREEFVESGEVKWGLGDGSYGFKGVSVESLKNKRTMSLIAAAMAEAGRVFQERKEVGTTGVSVVDQTARNAAYAGASAMLDGIVERMEEEIEAHGIYTVVTGGSEFWLYVDQDLWFTKSEVVAKTKPDHAKLKESNQSQDDSLSTDPLERLKQQVSRERGIPMTDFISPI